MAEFRCVDVDFGGVDSGQWCWPGCGAVVTQQELYASKLPCDDFALNLSLDMLVRARTGWKEMRG